MGLKFTTKETWQQWQDSRRRLHVLKDKVTGRQRPAAPIEPAMTFWARGDSPTLLVACDSNSPTNHHALLAPLEVDQHVPALIAAPATVELTLPSGQWARIEQPAELLTGIDRMASIGDHLGVGAWAHRLATQRGWRQVVVQHGLLTPFSPPPPRGVEWLAWSDGDADFVREGRPDLTTHVVGSAMLAAAAASPAEHVSRFETPVFLGQLHGAELPRASMTRSVTAFWRETGATYRPHPREEDRLSGLQHAAWRRMGMDFDTTPSLQLLNRPVVSAFSTGVLEAAARGVPAWVFHLDPPRWLEEMWERYGMHYWGQSRTVVSTPPNDPRKAALAQFRGGLQ